MPLPDIKDFQKAMVAEMERNKYKRDIPIDALLEGLWRNLRDYLKGKEPKKSLVDIANYAAVIWNKEPK